MLRYLMESLKEIIAKEVQKPKELLKRSKGEVIWIIAYVDALIKEVEVYIAEVKSQSTLARNAEKTKLKLLEQEQHLQTLVEVLSQTIGEEWDTVRYEWPKEYIGSLEQINWWLVDLIGSSNRPGSISSIGVILKSNDYNSPEALLSTVQRIKRILESIKREITVEETVFARDLQIAINNHVGKDFKQHAALYAGEIASTWNKKVEVEVKATTEEEKKEKILSFPPFLQTKLVLEIFRFERRTAQDQLKCSFKIKMWLWYDVVDETFKMQTAQSYIPLNQHAFTDYSKSNENKFDSIDEAFEQLARWFRK